ncbi:MAG: hypothetical protein H7138_12210, partial [Myxococcales bacterium]|nr:hypothetical protein [Myxococcales bacterium]
AGGSAPPHQPTLDDKSPGSPLSPGSAPGSVANRLTPSAFMAVDLSMSLPRRNLEFTGSKQDFSSPMPKAPATTWNIRRFIIVITIVLLAIAAYLLVRPK